MRCIGSALAKSVYTIGDLVLGKVRRAREGRGRIERRERGRGERERERERSVWFNSQDLFTSIIKEDDTQCERCGKSE